MAAALNTGMGSGNIVVTSATAPSGSTSMRTDRANVLIVDDRPDKLLVFKTILEELDQNIITAASGDLTAALTTLRSQSQAFGSNLSTVQIRQDFTKAMINTLQTGADSLTLADSNEEGANLLALQTRYWRNGLTTCASSADARRACARPEGVRCRGRSRARRRGPEAAAGPRSGGWAGRSPGRR